jgi:hypothetical protein
LLYLIDLQELMKNKSTIQEIDFWDDLTYLQKLDIQEGIDDLKAGRKKPLSEVMIKYLLKS